MRFRACLSLLLVILLAACGAFSKATPTPLPTVVLGQPAAGSGEAAAPTPTAVPGAQPAATVAPSGETASGGSAAAGGSVSASAEIVPALVADLSMAAPSLVQGLVVQEGDAVKAGEILATQDNIPQLQSALAASQKALDSAQKSYDTLLVNVPVQRANAQLALVKAQKALEDAQKTARSKQYQRASQSTIDLARARLIVANQALDDAQNLFNQVSGRGVEDQTYAAGLSQLATARQQQVQAQYNLNYALGLPSPLDIEEATVGVDLAQANLLAAKTAWEQLQNGDPKAEDAAPILAQIASAQASIDVAQMALDHAVLRAPFDGTVIAVNVTPGQLVGAGQVIMTIANLNTLQVETTDLSERDISRVSVGQPASVAVDGLNQTFTGQVVKIATRSTKVGGDVVYKVTIKLDELPPALRWGMSATVQIGP